MKRFFLNFSFEILIEKIFHQDQFISSLAYRISLVYTNLVEEKNPFKYSAWERTVSNL